MDKVACPRSFYGNAESADKVHFATPEELSRHNGVCRRCHEAIKKHHRQMQNNKLETPSQMNFKPRKHGTDEAPTGFADGTDAPVAQFPFDQIECDIDGKTNSEPDDLAKAAQVLEKIFLFCFTNDRDKIETPLLRFFTITTALRPDLTGFASFGKVAESVGFTKAAASKVLKNFERTFNWKSAASRGEAGCRAMSNAASRYWRSSKANRRRHTA